ncbi:malonic semialdehyde reductase [Micrococcus sp.]|uniref:malonic semialdehyde reductase n=1 Tax=Micrococcus sp. TaxID=1271 RepID=UPI002A90C931|nr:malonic semialdehyde reductase [Micrococcus sp.]MDY6056125.1 malonic semialdehyde reductase [Micrococcus sp.]
MTTKPTVLPEALLDQPARDALFAGAHTTYRFTEEPVDLEQVRRAYDDARWAPTAFNSQPLRMVALTTDEAKARIVPFMADVNAERTGLAPLVLVLAYDQQWHRNAPTLMPTLLAMQEVFETDHVWRESIGQGSGLLQAGYLTLALRAHGLQVGPMTGFDVDGVRAEFLAGRGWEPLIVMNVGHAAHPEAEDAVLPRAGRLEFSEVTEIL